MASSTLCRFIFAAGTLQVLALACQPSDTQCQADADSSAMLQSVVQSVLNQPESTVTKQATLAGSAVNGPKDAGPKKTTTDEPEDETYDWAWALLEKDKKGEVLQDVIEDDEDEDDEIHDDAEDETEDTESEDEDDEDDDDDDREEGMYNSLFLRDVSMSDENFPVVPPHFNGTEEGGNWQDCRSCMMGLNHTKQHEIVRLCLEQSPTDVKAQKNCRITQRKAICAKECDYLTCRSCKDGLSAQEKASARQLCDSVHIHDANNRQSCYDEAINRLCPGLCPERATSTLNSTMSITYALHLAFQKGMLRGDECNKTAAALFSDDAVIDNTGGEKKTSSDETTKAKEKGDGYFEKFFKFYHGPAGACEYFSHFYNYTLYDLSMPLVYPRGSEMVHVMKYRAGLGEKKPLGTISQFNVLSFNGDRTRFSKMVVLMDKPDLLDELHDASKQYRFTDRISVLYHMLVDFGHAVFHDNTSCLTNVPRYFTNTSVIDFRGGGTKEAEYFTVFPGNYAGVCDWYAKSYGHHLLNLSFFWYQRGNDVLLRMSYQPQVVGTKGPATSEPALHMMLAHFNDDGSLISGIENFFDSHHVWDEFHDLNKIYKSQGSRVFYGDEDLDEATAVQQLDGTWAVHGDIAVIKVTGTTASMTGIGGKVNGVQATGTVDGKTIHWGGLFVGHSSTLASDGTLHNSNGSVWIRQVALLLQNVLEALPKDTDEDADADGGDFFSPRGR